MHCAQALQICGFYPVIQMVAIKVAKVLVLEVQVLTSEDTGSCLLLMMMCLRDVAAEGLDDHCCSTLPVPVKKMFCRRLGLL